ncbi:Gti1/Pac2 family-domain-containing protein [Paraphysoderma sedebokerense]|nr:Gti1/Pac2 family-domain-containing protein [Paraphysoderma sedebokerense]
MTSIASMSLPQQYLPHPSSSPTLRYRIENVMDAVLLVEASRLGIVTRMKTRLSDSYQRGIEPGTAFIYDEEESRIKRWTDGMSWSAGRVSGAFLLYKEQAQNGIRLEMSFFKKTLLVESSSGQKYHLVYYGVDPASFPQIKDLPRPIEVFNFRIRRNTYPKLEIAHQLQPQYPEFFVDPIEDFKPRLNPSAYPQTEAPMSASHFEPHNYEPLNVISQQRTNGNTAEISSSIGVIRPYPYPSPDVYHVQMPYPDLPNEFAFRKVQNQHIREHSSYHQGVHPSYQVPESFSVKDFTDVSTLAFQDHNTHERYNNHFAYSQSSVSLPLDHHQQHFHHSYRQFSPIPSHPPSRTSPVPTTEYNLHTNENLSSIGHYHSENSPESSEIYSSRQKAASSPLRSSTTTTEQSSKLSHFADIVTEIAGYEKSKTRQPPEIPSNAIASSVDLLVAVDSSVKGYGDRENYNTQRTQVGKRKLDYHQYNAFKESNRFTYENHEGDKNVVDGETKKRKTSIGFLLNG